MDNYCTIYSHELYFDNIVPEIQKVFPKGKVSVSEQDGQKIIYVSIKEGLFKPKKEFQISYRERAQPSYQISEIDSPLTQNLSGMSGFVNSLPSSNEKVKGLLLQKIQTLNSEFPILSEGNLDEELKILTKNMCQSCDGILFIRPDTNISRSETQHFLDKDLNLILDTNGNCDIDHLDVNINAAYFDEEQTKVTEDQKNRKSKSESIINERQIKLNSNLPCIASENTTILRTPKEIAERVAILATTNMVAFNNITGEQAIDYLKNYDLLEKVTEKELSFLNNPTDEAKSYETWKCECIWVLMWALEIVEEIGFPDTLASLDNIPSEQYPIGEGKDPNIFIKGINSSRGKTEILDANDLYYRLDWTCVDARVNGIELDNLHPGVVYERHYALNWLIQYRNQNWDDVSCDT
ncbi:DUF4272 domain-containing protein [Aquimarina algiphila]|uniref:DUF4272 domain-containing protein n=1 Tax=Aquimarina algiphila TaxID=2047982 RepID=UPI00248F742E|nr:DUF4272 domain-containing protein [Aquimarina algiphila]